MWPLVAPKIVITIIYSIAGDGNVGILSLQNGGTDPPEKSKRFVLF